MEDVAGDNVDVDVDMAGDNVDVDVDVDDVAVSFVGVIVVIENDVDPIVTVLGLL